MENFALITLVEELGQAAAGMTVRRVSRHAGDVFFLETRSGKMPGLKLSLDSPNPALWIPRRPAAAPAETDDFVMVLRKHLLSGRLATVGKPLSERVVELGFHTALPTEELRQVILVAELFPNSPNLLLLDRSRRILASARPLSRNRTISQFSEYSYPETGKIPLDAVLGEDISWFDSEAFARDPAAWLLRNVGGVGPLLAAEIVARRGVWAGAPEDAAGMLAGLIRRLRTPGRTAWIYTTHPLGSVLEGGGTKGLRSAIASPIELESLRERWSCQTFPGMLSAMAALADPLEAASLLERARTPELRRLRREARRLRLKRERLLERQRVFEDAPALQTTARLLAASGAEMDRRHAEVTVTEYTGEGARTRSIALEDPSRTLRENISGMFRRQQKARRGLGLVARELASLTAEELRLEARQRHLMTWRHWDDWRAATPTPARRAGSEPGRRPPPRRRYRALTLDGHEILVGRNSRENDELTFRVAAGDDFWLHVADYSGSHVIVKNPSGAAELDDQLLARAAGLAAYHSQARNSTGVDVHYTQRKFVSKPKKGQPGLVRLSRFQSIRVEPRDWTRESDRRVGTAGDETHRETPEADRGEADLAAGLRAPGAAEDTR